MSEVKFDVTASEMTLVLKIVARSASLLNLESLGSSRQSLAMDLCACHLNGCPLNFKRLLEFPEFDFLHDAAGIIRHMDRSTGKVTDCFLPRSAKVQRAPARCHRPLHGRVTRPGAPAKL